MANFKFVKSATALVLGASVLTSAVVVPGANASAKTTYKVNKNGTLVNAKTNKTVKGYVSYKGKLYKDGKKFTGLYNKKYYYKSGVKGTGTYKGAYYVKGAKKVTTGTYNGKYYVKGALYTGKTSKNVYYVKGVKFTGVTKYGYTYKDGKRVEGEYQGKVYTNGKLVTGLYKDKLYKAGELVKGFALEKEKLYKDGVLNIGLALFQDKLYNDADLNKGLKKYEDKFYFDADLADGTYDDNGVERAIEKGVEVGAKVKSVEAINAGEIVVTFNKSIKESSVIEQSGANAGTLVDGAFTLTTANGGSVAVDGMNAELDGKTLTIYTATPLTGAYNFNVTKDMAKDLSDNYVEASSKTINVKDETRASITGVKKVSKYVYDVTLSEPVDAASLTGITAKLADGTSVLDATVPALRDNNKTIRVTLANTTAADKEVTITIPSLTDLANNVSIPLTQKVTVSDADKTPATVTSAVSTSASTIDVTFSEAVNVTTANFTFNGAPVTSVSPKTGDKTGTKYVVTLASEQTTAGYLALAASATTDLSGNPSVASTHLINFAGDKVAPTIDSSKVITDTNGDNYLVLQLSEKVRKNTTTPAKVTALSFSYDDQYGIAQTTTVPAANVTVDPTDASVVKVKLDDGASPAVKLVADKAYSVKFGAGYFEDLYKNESVAKTVSFTNTGSKDSAKLGVTGAITNGVDLNGAFVTVNFDKAVDPASAKDASNYKVEGSTVKEVKLINNSTSGAQVKVYLTNDTIAIGGKYNVTVKDVKGYDSNVKALDLTTQSVTLAENVGAKVASKVITFNAGTPGTTTVAVTFDESVHETAANGDYALYIAGVKSTDYTVTNNATSASTTVTFTIGKDLSSEIAAGKEVKLVATDDLDLVDTIGNKINTSDIILK